MILLCPVEISARAFVNVVSSSLPVSSEKKSSLQTGGAVLATVAAEGSTSSPLGRSGSEGGLSRLIRSAGGDDVLSGLFSSSSSESELSKPRCGSGAPGLRKSYAFGCDARKSLDELREE